MHGKVNKRQWKINAKKSKKNKHKLKFTDKSLLLFAEANERASDWELWLLLLLLFLVAAMHMQTTATKLNLWQIWLRFSYPSTRSTDIGPGYRVCKQTHHNRTNQTRASKKPNFKAIYKFIRSVFSLPFALFFTGISVCQRNPSRRFNNNDDRAGKKKVWKIFYDPVRIWTSEENEGIIKERTKEINYCLIYQTAYWIHN